MPHTQLVKKFNEKIKDERYTKKDIWEKYMKPSGIGYVYFINQVNGFAPMRENVEAAIQKYLDDK